MGLCKGIFLAKTMYGLGNSIYPEGTQNFSCEGVFHSVATAARCSAKYPETTHRLESVSFFVKPPVHLTSIMICTMILSCACNR